MTVTLPLVLGLIDEGRLTLDTPAASLLPEFASGGKEEVTVGQLLTHTSGLPPLVNLYSSHLTREEMWQTVYRTPLQAKPGTRMAYSDVGYMTLGRIAEEMLGVPLDEAARDKIFGPLGMDSALFCPPAGRAADIAPTEYDASAGVRLHGVVHDENARALGGVSGHAGLCAAAGDLVRYARMWLGCGLVPARPPVRVMTRRERKRPGRVSSRGRRPLPPCAASRRASPARAAASAGRSRATRWMPRATGWGRAASAIRASRAPACGWTPSGIWPSCC